MYVCAINGRTRCHSKVLILNFFHFHFHFQALKHILLLLFFTSVHCCLAHIVSDCTQSAYMYTVTKLAWRSLAILVQYSYDDHIQMCARLGWLWLACIVTVLDILIIAFVRTVRSITFEINPYSPSPPTHSHWSYNELSVCDETVYRCVWVTFAFAEI